MNTEEVADFFKDKKIILMGLGVLGRGVGDAAFLAECGAQVLVTDLKDKEELQESLSKLREYSNISYRLGGHEIDDFRNCDMVIKAAGVPKNSPYITEARKYSIPVEMSTALFARLAPIRHIIGVTGTRGKSTTTQLIYEILKGDGRKVVLGGNVQGVSTLAKLSEVNEETTAVLELDSWQLQGFGDSGMSPSVAVFTNFFPDHMDYYRGDKEAYFGDKANIFKYQSTRDTLILGKRVAEEVEKRGYELRSRKIVVSTSDLAEEYTLKISG